MRHGAYWLTDAGDNAQVSCTYVMLPAAVTATDLSTDLAGLLAAAVNSMHLSLPLVQRFWSGQDLCSACGTI